jgi:hypothetical protein
VYVSPLSSCLRRREVAEREGAVRLSHAGEKGGDCSKTYTTYTQAGRLDGPRA